jgi:non-ribosomal peptide synthetase-like protein
LAGAPPRRREALFGVLHLAMLYLIGFALSLTAVPGSALLWWAASRGMRWRMTSLPVAGVTTMVGFCLAVVILKRLLLLRVEPGVYPVESGLYLRKWSVDILMQMSRTLARPLYTTIYLPPWLRLLGATIGRRAEMSTVTQIAPELTRIGEQSFFADGSMIGGRRAHRGLLELAESRVGDRSFVGNSAILPAGKSLGNGCLLGCLSAPPAGQQRTPDGTEWLGSPSFALPHRPRLGGFDESVTHEPTPRLIAQRLVVDALRIAIPMTLATGALEALSALVEHGYETLPPAQWLLTVPLAAMAVATAGLASTVAVKKILIGTFTPRVVPLWSMFVWLNEVVNGTYETVAAPILTLLQGTPYGAPWLRRMGCRIGRHVYLETTHFSEFDLVRIGDYVALNAGAVIQNHLFEDRIMKASVLEIGDDCTVGNMAVVLYDTEMQAGSSIGPLSLLMKGETLPPETRWAGIPTAPASRWVAALPSSPSPALALAGEAVLLKESA